MLSSGSGQSLSECFVLIERYVECSCDGLLLDREQDRNQQRNFWKQHPELACKCSSVRFDTEVVVYGPCYKGVILKVDLTLKKRQLRQILQNQYRLRIEDNKVPEDSALLLFFTECNTEQSQRIHHVEEAAVHDDAQHHEPEADYVPVSHYDLEAHVEVVLDQSLGCSVILCVILLPRLNLVALSEVVLHIWWHLSNQGLFSFNLQSYLQC